VVPGAELPAVPPAIPDAERIARRAHALAASRPLFKSLSQEVETAALRGEKERIGKRPDLNLVAQATATRVEPASAPALATGPSQSQLGYYGSVALQFALPLPNRSARGAFAQATAAHTEALLNLEQRRNAVNARVDTLSSAMASLTQTYQERARAAQQLELAYEAERTKFRLGRATVLDVVLAEQQYMSASLATVGDRAAYAVTLARLLHEAGGLGVAVQARDALAVVRTLVNPTF
jgi:outer membrane protein TolC